MTLNLGDDVLFQGPALPEAFVRHELEKLLGPGKNDEQAEVVEEAPAKPKRARKVKKEEAA